MTGELFLGAGVGRSGTMWTAWLFTVLGHPCGHEQLYRPAQRGPLTAAEVSWLAVPYLTSLPAGTPVVRIIRDPWHVVQSVMRERFLDEPDATPYDVFVGEHRPWILQPRDKLGRAIRWACEWDRPLDDWPHVALHPDRGDPEHTAAAVKHATGATHDVDQVRDAMAGLGRVNTARSTRTAPTLAGVNSHREAWRLRRRAEQWGYPSAPQ